MDNSYNILFLLLRNELWQEPKIRIELTDPEVKRLFEDAKKQAVLGLVANALMRNNADIGREWVYKALTLTNQIKASNERINSELVKFTEFMNRNNVKFWVVKGQTVATLYPDSLLRCPGDIDFYCDASNFNLTQNLIKNVLNINVENTSAKHIEFKMNGVHYEMHSKLTEFSYDKHQVYWERILKESLNAGKYSLRINESDIPILPPTINALYIFCHIFYHLIINGIGLRQFCDLALFLDRHHEEIDRKLLDEYLINLGIKKAFTATGYVLTDLLGLKQERFPYGITDRDRWVGKRIVTSVMKDGNWASDKQILKKKGLLHSMQTAYLCFIQSMKYVDVAPMECLLRMPKLGEFFIEKLKR